MVDGDSPPVVGDAQQSNAAVPPYTLLPVDFTVRLQIDDSASKFLCDLAGKIEALSSGDFQSALSCRAPAPFTVTVITNLRNGGITNSCRPVLETAEAESAASTDSLAAAAMLTELTSVLAKTASIFGPVQCALLPNCKMTLLLAADGESLTGSSGEVYSVAVKFKNHPSAPHFDQVEEFLKLNIVERVFGGPAVRVQYWNRIYCVTIGYYCGPNWKQFQLWLNNELLKLRDIMPVFSGSLLELQYSLAGRRGAAADIDGTESATKATVKDTVFQYQLSG